MCNLYHLAPRDHIETYFRAFVPEGYQPVAVGPFGAGAFLRLAGTNLEVVLGQWGMIGPGAKTRRPKSRAILTNNARAEVVSRLVCRTACEQVAVMARG